MTPDKPHLLLHLCCGPCATAVIERLLERFHITAFWHNPNIHPPEEHQRRLGQARIVAREFDLELVEEPGEEAGWLEAVTGLEEEPEGGRRCAACYELRLKRAAEEAVRRGIPTLATTLTLSPHKSASEVNSVGRAVAEVLGLSFVEEDFKQRGGFQRSVEKSRELGLYRQRHCGCRFSASKG